MNTEPSSAPSKDVFLVIGGSGFLGRHIVQKLTQRGYAVAVFDIVQRHHDAPFFSGDICVLEDIVSALRESSATCIIHTASPAPNTDNLELLQKVNVDGTRTVIAAARVAGIRKLVYTSSAGVVFKGLDLAGVDETHPIPPPQEHFQVYNKTKAAAEDEVIAANDVNGLLTCALRPAGIFGPGDQLMLSTLYETYKRGLSRIQLGDNSNLFDYTYVENVADAHVLAAEQLVSSRQDVAGQVFFITNDDPIPFWDFTKTVYKGFDRYTGQTLTAARPTVIPRSLSYALALLAECFGWITGKTVTFTRMNVTYTCSTRWHNMNKAKSVLGYVPQIKVYEGLQKTMEWWAQEHNFSPR